MRTQKLLAPVLALCLLASPAFAESGVYYEIFPASFYDSDGDGHGDLAGIAAQLPYLETLGVDGLWLMPIHPSPSYHKYDVLDYCAVDPAYGTVQDAQALADALHARGMTLLLDLVINHTSIGHPWFQAAAESLRWGTPDAYREYYHFSQEAAPGWHAVPGAPGWYYFGHFGADMPDLNLENESLREEILNVCAYWLDLGIDGFRLDAIPHYFEENIEDNNAFVCWLMESLREMHPDVYVVGEVWKDAGSIERYYTGGISSLFNFPFSGPEGAIVSAIRGRKGAAFAKQAAAWQAVWSAFPEAADAPFLSNHDNARIAGTLMQKPESLKLAASMLLTLPGTPFLYYGEEIGMTGSGRDENKRLPMLWDAEETPGYCLPPASADQLGKYQGSVKSQLEDEDSLLNHYRLLLALRSEHSALREGTLTPIDTGIDAVCGYTLAGAGETLLVLHNLGTEPVTVHWDGSVCALDAQSSFIGNPSDLAAPSLSGAIFSNLRPTME